MSAARRRSGAARTSASAISKAICRRMPIGAEPIDHSPSIDCPGRPIQWNAAPRSGTSRATGSALAALPPAVQVRLSGKPPVRIDGDTLAAEMQLTLALLERRGEPAPETLGPVQARRERRRLAAIYAGRPASVGAVRELEIE